jgi:hypothetical protein
VSADPRPALSDRRDTEHRLTHDIDVWVASASADAAGGGGPLPRKKSLEQRTEEAKAQGARLTAAKQSLRDSLIVQRSAQGWLRLAARAPGVNG